MLDAIRLVGGAVTSFPARNRARATEASLAMARAVLGKRRDEKRVQYEHVTR